MKDVHKPASRSSWTPAESYLFIPALEQPAARWLQRPIGARSILENIAIVSNTIGSSLFFEQVVSEHYAALYRFAISLARSEADACDLTQQTFYIWATKGHQLRDARKVKSWLFTILHREFLNLYNRATRFPQLELNDETIALNCLSSELVHTLDTTLALEFVGQVQEPYRAALSLFYLEDYSYKEIAEILEIPLGTVRSRISRGLAQLQRAILNDAKMPTLRETP